MSNVLLLSTADQRIIRFSLSWLLHETYGHTKRPQLSDATSQTLSLLIQQFDAWFDSEVLSLTVVDDEASLLKDVLRRELPGESLPLLKLAVDAFLGEVVPIPGEFKIITGLPLADAESLLARLHTAVSQADPGSKK